MYKSPPTRNDVLNVDASFHGPLAYRAWVGYEAENEDRSILHVPPWRN